MILICLDNHSHARLLRRRPAAFALAGSSPSPAARRSRRAREPPTVRCAWRPAFYPLQFVARAGRRRPRRRRQPDHPRRGAARPRADDEGDRRDRRGRPGGLSSAGSSRRSTTPSNQRRGRGPRRRRRRRRWRGTSVDSTTGRPALLAGPAAARRGRPTPSPTRSRTVDPDHADDFAANAADLRGDLDPSTRRTPPGWPPASGHGGRHPRRLRLPRPLRPRLRRRSPASPPTPSRRPADLGRLQALIERRRHHHRLRRAAGQPPLTESLAARHGHRPPRCSTRSRASPTRPPTTTTFR